MELVRICTDMEATDNVAVVTFLCLLLVQAGYLSFVLISVYYFFLNTLEQVAQMASYFEPLIMAAIGTASKILSSQQQMAVLDQTKTLTESALQMLYTAKEAGGNPKVMNLAPVTQSPLDKLVEKHGQMTQHYHFLRADPLRVTAGETAKLLLDNILI